MDPLSSNISADAAIDRTKVSPQSQERERKLKKACADFEAMLVFQMMKTMRQTVPQNGFLKPSQGRATFEAMLDQKIADEASRKGEGMGLQRVLYDQLTRSVGKKD